MPVISADYAMGEMLAVLLARDMADGEKAIVGTNSDIQVAACNLARQRQAPQLWWVSGPGGMTNPTEGVVRPAADSEKRHRAADANRCRLRPDQGFRPRSRWCRWHRWFW